MEGLSGRQLSDGGPRETGSLGFLLVISSVGENKTCAAGKNKTKKNEAPAPKEWCVKTCTDRCSATMLWVELRALFLQCCCLKGKTRGHSFFKSPRFRRTNMGVSLREHFLGCFNGKQNGHPSTSLCADYSCPGVTTTQDQPDLQTAKKRTYKVYNQHPLGDLDWWYGEGLQIFPLQKPGLQAY